NRSTVLAHLGGEIGHPPWRRVPGLKPPHEHLKRRVRRLVRVSLVLQLLEVVHEPPRLRVVTVELEPELSRLRQNVAAPRELRHEHARLVSHPGRIDVLISILVPQDCGHVLPALVRESAVAYERLL